MVDALLQPSGKSREQLCKESGINRSYLWQVERGKRNPSLQLYASLRSWGLRYHGSDLGKRLVLELGNDRKFLERHSLRGRKRKVN